MKQNNNDERFMRLAIDQAWLGKNTPGGAEVGCVIAAGGVLLASGFNEAELRNDPTAHAEIVTLRRLGEKLNRIEFRECTITARCNAVPCVLPPASGRK
jgi:tRNA(adenine34) deaminase